MNVGSGVRLGGGGGGGYCKIPQELPVVYPDRKHWPNFRADPLISPLDLDRCNSSPELSACVTKICLVLDRDELIKQKYSWANLNICRIWPWQLSWISLKLCLWLMLVWGSSLVFDRSLKDKGGDSYGLYLNTNVSVIHDMLCTTAINNPYRNSTSLPVGSTSFFQMFFSLLQVFTRVEFKSSIVSFTRLFYWVPA